jgi:AI2M/AI1M-like HNH endonuclease/type II intron maturase
VTALRVPRDVITAKCAPYPRRGKPEARTALCNLDDYDIVAAYGAEYRGIVRYYLLATDVWRIARLRWAAETSMLKTLAAKRSSTVTAMAARHKAKIETPHGIRTCFEARVERDGKQPLVARFGGIPLVRRKTAVLTDRAPAPVLPCPVKELTIRLRRGRCELCEEPAKAQVHQIRKLAQLGKPGPGLPPWAVLMARKRRKTLVVCHPCHDTIHHGHLTATTAQITGEPRAGKLARGVLAATLSAHDSAWLGVHDPARLGEQLAWAEASWHGRVACDGHAWPGRGPGTATAGGEQD